MCLYAIKIMLNYTNAVQIKRKWNRRKQIGAKIDPENIIFPISILCKVQSVPRCRCATYDTMALNNLFLEVFSLRHILTTPVLKLVNRRMSSRPEGRELFVSLPISNHRRLFPAAAGHRQCNTVARKSCGCRI